MNIEDVVKFVVLPVGTTLAALWLKSPIEKHCKENVSNVGLVYSLIARRFGMALA